MCNHKTKRIAHFLLFAALLISNRVAAERPNIVLVMTDDQGWGQTGYYQHPHLRTPNLDAMAANGLRLDRFYAGASNCSPTRATVLTGRSNDRTGVQNHGFPLRLQEKTVAQALRDAGYATGHFGKWHLNGLRGPGVPILKGDTHNPKAFGFDSWLSVTNFFDLDPLMSRKGEFEQFKGDSSDVTVAEAISFITTQSQAEKPFLAVIWFGSPHSPMAALEKDKAQFSDLPADHQNHLGELVAMDRSIGALRAGLRKAGVAKNTLVWFNSDNGGLKGYGAETVGGLRGWKSTMYEGGLRVPCVIEWPAIIRPRVSEYPGCTVDIFPTIAEIVGLPKQCMVQPQDGQSLRPLFDKEIGPRRRPLFFRHSHRGVVIDDQFKLLSQQRGFELYDLKNDPHEKKNLYDSRPKIAERLVAKWNDWNQSVEKSVSGNDYPEGRVLAQPERRFWRDDPAYAPYVKAWSRQR